MYLVHRMKWEMGNTRKTNEEMMMINISYETMHEQYGKTHNKNTSAIFR